MTFFRRHPAWLSPLALLLCLLGGSALGAADDLYDQSGVPLEVQPTDPKLVKIVLVAGTPSQKSGEHEYFAGCAVLMKLLRQTPGVFPVMARDGWPKDSKVFQNARCIVFYMNGGGDQPLIKGDHLAEVQKLADSGAGLVHLHAV